MTLAQGTQAPYSYAHTHVPVHAKLWPSLDPHCCPKTGHGSIRQACLRKGV